MTQKIQKIPLTRNRYALVDEEDVAFVMQWNWYAGQVRKNHWYAMRKEGRRTIYMHIELMKRWYGEPAMGLLVDHCDGDGLDNRRSNLRYVTRAENLRNNYRRRRMEVGHAVRAGQIVAAQA